MKVGYLHSLATRIIISHHSTTAAVCNYDNNSCSCSFVDSSTPDGYNTIAIIKKEPQLTKHSVTGILIWKH